MEANNSEVSQKDQKVERICLLCHELKRKPIQQNNFSRHLKEFHTERFNELKGSGRTRISKPEYLKDFIYPSEDQLTLSRFQQIGSNSDRFLNPGNDSAQIQLDPKNYLKRDDSEMLVRQNLDESEMPLRCNTLQSQNENNRKRDLKFLDKQDASFTALSRKSAPKMSVTSFTDASVAFTLRMDTIEDENDQLREQVNNLTDAIKKQEKKLEQQELDIRKLQEIIIAQQSLKVSDHISQFKGIHSFQQPLSEVIKDVIDDRCQSEVAGGQSDVVRGQQKVQRGQEQPHRGQVQPLIGKGQPLRSQQLSQRCQEEVKGNIEDDINNSWKTWVNCQLFEELPNTYGNKLFKSKGQERSLIIKDGKDFSTVTKHFVSLQKEDLKEGQYQKEVAEFIKGIKIIQGYNIIDIINIGNVGTALIAEDFQEKTKVVLKVYHKREFMTGGVKEFEMLFQLQNAPSIMKVYNVMYNPRGTFLVLSLEDLTRFFTLYTMLTDIAISKEQKLKIALNICKGVAELHQMNVVHGDLASENILIHPYNFEIKIIDFDLARFDGDEMKAAGNLDFVNQSMHDAIQNRDTIKVSKKNDLYSLGIVCYLILGDQNKRYYNSLSGKSLSFYQRNDLISKGNYNGKSIIESLIKNEVTAAEASEKFHEALEIIKQE